MDREKKIKELKVLKEQIKQKESEIKNKQNELHTLKEQANKINESELPILLFTINETLPMPEDERDWEYEYVYYCPDLDEVKYIHKHKNNELLPNSIDLRNSFKIMGMPEHIWPSTIQSDPENYNKIEVVVSYLKDVINDLFKSQAINSWEELASCLNDLDMEKENVKTLRLNNSKK
mgnify:CR=1 FL=1